MLVWIGEAMIRLGITLVVWGTRREHAETFLDRWGALVGVRRETEDQFSARIRQRFTLPSAGRITDARQAFEAALPAATDCQRAARELLDSYQ